MSFVVFFDVRSFRIDFGVDLAFRSQPILELFALLATSRFIELVGAPCDSVEA
jgi:hypothetical protein